jgi:hypothetical protein
MNTIYNGSELRCSRRGSRMSNMNTTSSGTPEFTSVIYGVHVAQSAPSSGTPEFTSVIYGVHVAHSAPSSGTPEFTVPEEEAD